MARSKKSDDAVVSPPSSIREEIRFSSGCYPLDLVLGGGYVVGRVIDIYGESATGKTYLAAQAVSEFFKAVESPVCLYVDTEQTFSTDFASKVGCPPQSDTMIIRNDITSLQELYSVLLEVKESFLEKGHNVLVVVDSLDALVDQAEADAGATLSGFAVGKPKFLSAKLFPLITMMIGKFGQHLTFYIVSQARSSLNPYGPKEVRSGGRALKFYCSQILHISKQDIKKTVLSRQVPIGLNIKVVVEKNKCGSFGQSVVVPVYFNSGISNNQACALFLSDFGKKERAKEFMEEWKGAVSEKAATEIFDRISNRLRAEVAERWAQFERVIAERNAGDLSDTEI
jgi:recombination protein RecA